MGHKDVARRLITGLQPSKEFLPIGMRREALKLFDARADRIPPA